MNIVKIGVLGTASIAQRSMVPAILKLSERFKLVGIASREMNKANIIAEKFRTTPYSGYESLIKSGSCDAIYIPLPTLLNGEYTRLALQNNLHVLVEKTMACDYNLVKEVHKIAKEKNLAIIENFQFRFHNQMNDIAKMIGSGCIGEIRCLNSSFGFPPFKDTNNIRYSSKLGGGALHDAGCYTIKISQLILGLEINVVASTLYKPNKIDLWGGALIQSSDNRSFAQISFGFDNQYQCKLDIWGSEGRLVTDRIFTAPSDLKPQIIIQNAKKEKKIEAKSCDHFENILKHFYNTIYDKRIKEAEYIENINQARLINEIKKKAR